MSTPHVPDDDAVGLFAEVKLAVLGVERYSCAHLLSEARDRACPQCGGTLRRCCLSLVGAFGHVDACPELAGRELEDAS